MSPDPEEQTEPSSSSSKDNKKPSFTKVVIRRLPPHLTESELLEQLSPLPEYDYFYFVSADLSLEPHAFSRAYFNIPSLTDICIFKDKFDGYVFVDPKGHEYPAMVEFAPYQKIPKGKAHRRKDPKMGTITEDPDYIEFLRVLEEREKGYHFTLDQHLDAIEAKEKERVLLDKKSTPLLEFLKEKRAEKYRIREEKREAKKKKKDEERKSKDQEKKAKRKEKRKEKFAESKESKEDRSSGCVTKEKKILQREKRPNSGEASENAEFKTKVFTNTTTKKEFGKGGKGPKNDKNKQKGQREGTPKEFRPFNPDQTDKLGERRKFTERPMHKEKRERNRPNRELQPKPQPQPKILKRPDQDTNDNQLGATSSTTGLTEDRTKVDAKPKRYSDRRKEERLKREMAKNPNNPVPEQTSGSSRNEDVQPGPSQTRNSKFEDDNPPPIKVKEPPSEEELRRKAEIQAKREHERQVRKERLKNKERPEMQIYRPGMGKFSSKTIKEGKANAPKVVEEISEGNSPGPGKRGGAGGGGRGYGRGRGRSGRGKIKPFGGGTEPTETGGGASAAQPTSSIE